ncbi:unnamed protein product [Protopolystoma xenopodis]|uniref:P-type ATPase C-terminal domain-containing protein n=1 Tax=Protopolystoma xenopodis TaxID=117903 RepID=A0A448WVA0_9PLAT|nr:unnamed protein product [Protopolystoma xenopodis]
MSIRCNYITAQGQWWNRPFIHFFLPPIRFIIALASIIFLLKLATLMALTHRIICLRYYEQEFIDLARQSPAVVVCRCSPTQKAAIVRLMRRYSGRVVAAIGDGGNDVGMIQSADIGLGLVGKEGRQASLASDFSLVQFRHITRLLLVHGRNAYKNTASLSQFVIHRGKIK